MRASRVSDDSRAISVPRVHRRTKRLSRRAMVSAMPYLASVRTISTSRLKLRANRGIFVKFNILFSRLNRECELQFGARTLLGVAL